jgi:non-specific serine/threonine protein kinase
LVECSLLRRIERGAEHEQPRYTMLETVREYASERLEASGEAETVRDAHAAWCTRLAAQAEPAMKGPGRERWSTRLEREHDNLRAALAWLETNGDAAASLRLAGLLWAFWFVSGHLSEGRGWLERALERGRTAPDVDQARALLGAGALAMAQGDFARATALLDPARARYDNLGDTADAATCLFFLGIVAQDEGDPATATTHLERALARYREAGDDARIGATLNNLGLVVARAGDPTRGEALLSDALAQHRRMGFDQGARTALRYLAQVVVQRGDVSRAGTLLQESLAPGWEHADKWHVAGALEGLAAVAALGDQAVVAARLLGASDALRVLIGVPVEPAKWAEYAELLTTVRAALGEPEFTQAWREGRALPLAQAVALAMAVESPPETPPAPTAVAGLTPREVEVLQLLARGRSNREIADTLFLSVRTVERHITNLYAKIDARGKADATAFAYQHGLMAAGCR